LDQRASKATSAQSKGENREPATKSAPTNPRGN